MLDNLQFVTDLVVKVGITLVTVLVTAFVVTSVAFATAFSLAALNRVLRGKRG